MMMSQKPAAPEAVTDPGLGEAIRRYLAERERRDAEMLRTLTNLLSMIERLVIAIAPPGAVEPDDERPPLQH